jgi:peptide/nickel transport system substrate-binding protein
MPGLYAMTNDSKLYCDMGKDLKISPDYKVFTFYMRKGVKWSDGQPFTTADIKYWWEDVVHDKDLTPGNLPWPWAQAGKLPELTILDDFSFEMKYEKSYIPLRGILTYWGTMAFCFGSGQPAHYMKQFHIKYNPAVVDEAKKEGYDNWYQYYSARNGPRDIKYGKFVPALTPWVVVDSNPQFYSWERNPYYWGVDTVGNQLPYIDKMLVQTVNDTETHNLKIVAGEVDWAAAWTKLADMPLYMNNEDKGGYEVVKYNNVNGSDMAWWFNLNHKDPIKRKIFQDPRWTQALSYATDRGEIQDVIYLGSGVKRQAAPDESNSFYKKEWGEFCVEYSPDKANQLLDEMGLDKKDSEGFRLTSDGKRLEILVEVTSAMDSPTLAVSNLAAPQWEKVGIKVTVQDRDRTLLEAKYPTGDYDCSGFHINRTGELMIYLGRLVNGGGNTYGVNEWWNWYSSNGAKGEEPPAEWKAHFKDVDDWYTAGNDAEYKTLAQKIFDFTILNYPLEIGTVGYPTQPGIISKNLRNVPKHGYMGDDVGQARSLYAESWYKKV